MAGIIDTILNEYLASNTSYNPKDWLKYAEEVLGNQFKEQDVRNAYETRFGGRGGGQQGSGSFGKMDKIAQNIKDVKNLTGETLNYGAFYNSEVKPSGNMFSKITNAFKAAPKGIAKVATTAWGPVVSGVVTGKEKYGHEQTPYVDNVVRAYDNANIIGSLGYLNPFTGIATFGKQAYNSAKAAEQIEMNKELMNTEYLDLLKAGIDPEVAFNNVYASKNAKVKPSDVGINIAKDREDQAKYLQQMNEIDTLEKQNADIVGNIQRMDMNNKLMQQALKEQPQRVGEASPVMTGGANQMVEASGKTSTPSGATDNVLAQAIGYSNPQGFDGLGNYGLQVGTSQGMAQAAYDASPEGQLMNTITQPKEGQIIPQDMMSILNDKYARLEQTIKNDPRYSGDIVQPNTPYNIDPQQLARYQSYDQFAKAFGVDGGMADLYQNQARQMYDQQMANQLGVPYEDYIAATTERRKYDILAQSQQIQDALQVQANQAKDMQTKLSILQKMQEVREKANNDLLLEDMRGRYDLAKAGVTAQAQRDVANINAARDIAKQQMYLTAPTTQLNAAGNYMGNLMGYGGGAVTLSNLLALSPQQRVALWGQNISDDAIRAMFANVRGIPATALQQPQLNQQQGGSQGFLPGLANFINPQR